jgi:hypothetical protein
VILQTHGDIRKSGRQCGQKHVSAVVRWRRCGRIHDNGIAESAKAESFPVRKHWVDGKFILMRKPKVPVSRCLAEGYPVGGDTIGRRTAAGQ